MDPDSTFELVCRGAGLAIAGLAVLLVVWGRFWDRARGRRRCPRCWYDMAGLPGLTCPECGRTARDERSLAKTRGRRWTLLGALVLLVAARVAWRGPEVWQRGWIATVPSSVLIPVATAIEPFDQPLPPPGATDYPSPGRWASELAARAVAGELAAWQWRWLLTRVGYIRSRERWPGDHPWVPCVGMPYWLKRQFSQQISVGETKLTYYWRERRHLEQWIWRGSADLPRGGRVVSVDVDIGLHRTPNVAAKTLWTGVVKLPVETVGALSDAVVPDATAELTEAIRASATLVFFFNAAAQRQYGVFELTLDLGAHPRLRDLAPGFAVELLRDGLPAKEPLRFEIPPSTLTDLRLRTMDILDLPPWWQEKPRELDRWSIRLRGDAASALYSHQGKAYWDGDIIIPMTELKITIRR